MPTTRTRFRSYHLLTAIPPIGLLAGIPFANRTEPYIAGLPFLLFWIVAWVIVISLTMGVIWLLDARSGAQSAPPSHPRT